MTKYIKNSKGNCPIIISVPHGGSILPPNMRLRERGCFLRDDNLIFTSKSIKKYLTVKNLKPYFVYSRISRKDIDFNRDLFNAQNSNNGKKLWQRYHNKISEYQKEIVKIHGYCLYFDLHGQSTRDFVEVGYSEKLNKIHWSQSSFGSSLNKFGIDCYPSPKRKKMSGRYRSGGYSIKHHSGKKIESIQIEINRQARVNRKNRKIFSEKFSKAVIDFLDSRQML